MRCSRRVRVSSSCVAHLSSRWSLWRARECQKHQSPHVLPELNRWHLAPRRNPTGGLFRRSAFGPPGAWARGANRAVAQCSRSLRSTELRAGSGIGGQQARSLLESGTRGVLWLIKHGVVDLGQDDRSPRRLAARAGRQLCQGGHPRDPRCPLPVVCVCTAVSGAHHGARTHGRVPVFDRRCQLRRAAVERRRERSLAIASPTARTVSVGS